MRAVGTALLSLSVATACGGPNLFQVKHEAEAPADRTVAMFGVFHDGQMDSHAWEIVTSKLLRTAGCEPLYGPGFIGGNPKLAASVETYVRDNGVSEPLLAEFAASTDGDRIMSFTIAGRVARVTGRSWVPDNPVRMTRSVNGGHYIRHLDDGWLFISAEVFSIRLHRIVDRLAMEYRGTNSESALTQFADKLALEIPIASCRAWKSQPLPDPQRIRTLDETP
jgi:hypothetical protein